MQTIRTALEPVAEQAGNFRVPVAARAVFLWGGNMSYKDDLKDPRWQKKRLEIMDRDGWTCRECGDTSTTLHIHHLCYDRNKKPWEYENNYLITLCAICHEEETINYNNLISAMRNVMAKHGCTSGEIITIVELLYYLLDTFSIKEITALVYAIKNKDAALIEMVNNISIQFHQMIKDNLKRMGINHG